MPLYRRAFLKDQNIPELIRELVFFFLFSSPSQVKYKYYTICHGSAIPGRAVLEETLRFHNSPVHCVILVPAHGESWL